MADKTNDKAPKVERGPRNLQKLKIMYILKILQEKTDETHAITLQEIVAELHRYGVTAERKSIYSDLEHLRDFGIDVIGTQKDRTYYYQLGSREFQLAELKLLVDAVSAAKFITKNKSDEIIKKIESFASKYEADQLRRQVSVNGRVKTENKKVIYSVDSIHEAINSNRQITFQYFKWNTKKQMELVHDGKIYHVSPWALCWDDEKYYLIGFDADDQKMKHFRVDKMTNTELSEDRRIGKKEFDEIKMSDVTNRYFGMFEGDVRKVELLCPNYMANVIVDRFGTDVRILKNDENTFKAKVDVAVTDLFLSWVMALKGVKIIGPEDVVEKMKEKVKEQYKLYK